MSQNDPTDNALAAIASILDQPPVIPRERERPAVEDLPTSPPPLEEAPASLAVPPPLEPAPPLEASMPFEAHLPVEAHGYSRVGPGPMAAIRFKWTVRLDHGDYYVDETVGENSNPLVTGPLDRDAAIQLVDDRETEARRRFEQLKSEMTGRSADANSLSKATTAA